MFVSGSKTERVKSNSKCSKNSRTMPAASCPNVKVENVLFLKSGSQTYLTFLRLKIVPQSSADEGVWCLYRNVQLPTQTNYLSLTLIDSCSSRAINTLARNWACKNNVRRFSWDGCRTPNLEIEKYQRPSRKPRPHAELTRIFPSTPLFSNVCVTRSLSSASSSPAIFSLLNK